MKSAQYYKIERFFGPSKNDECKFGLKSKTFPSHITEMKKFENDLIDMIETIKFKKVNDQFLTNYPRT